MDVVASFPSDAQVAEAVQPGADAFNDPALDTEA